MDELFNRLERQIRNLVDQQTRLQETNYQLKHSKGSLAQENDELHARQEKAIATIEALVSRLKAIEKKS